MEYVSRFSFCYAFVAEIGWSFLLSMCLPPLAGLSKFTPDFAPVQSRQITR